MSLKIQDYRNGCYEIDELWYHKVDGKWHFFSVINGKRNDYGESDTFCANRPENLAVLEGQVRKLKLEKLLK